MPPDINQSIGDDNTKNQNRVQDDWFSERYGATMDTLGSRLKYARDAVPLTQEELALRVGYKGQSAIEAIEVGRSLRPTRIHEIARACGVTVEWLQGREEGAPLKSEGAKRIAALPPALPSSVPMYDMSSANSMKASGGSALVELTDNAVEALIISGAARSRSSVFLIDEPEIHLGAAYAGGIDDNTWINAAGVPSHEPVARWGLPSVYVERELGLSLDAVGILRVRGDSMDDGSNRSIASGDRVIIDQRETDTRQGGIYAVFDGDGVIVKQVELLRGHEPQRILCTSLNSAYRPIELVLDGSVRVIGRVAGVISRR